MRLFRMMRLMGASAMLFAVSSAVRGEVPANSQGRGMADGYIDVHMHLDGMYRQDGGGQSSAKGPGMSGPGKMGRRAQTGRGTERPSGGEGRPRGGMVKDYETAADHLIVMMDKCGVAKAVVMPPPQVANQHGGYTCKDLLGAIRRHPQRLALAGGGGELGPIIMGTASSAVTPAIRAGFERKADDIIRDGARAFGEMTALHFSLHQGHPFEQAPADHPLFLLLADIAARYDVPIDLHMEAATEDMPLPQRLGGRSSANPSVIQATIPPFERLLAHNRKTRIVWQHIGWDNTGQMTPALVRRLLEAHPNLYLAMKSVQTKWEPFRIGLTILDEQVCIRAEWVGLIRDHPDRFMIGADEFVGIPGRTTRKGPPCFENTWAIPGQLPAELRDKVGRENAARVYRLN
ncbi:MAG: amidohydrolase family protein [Verrucomicrobia bacterium]|nr:amidohydrolase family protein [Verrucomicrobiota bacterium]